VISIAIDTCEPRGSVAIRRDGKLIAMRLHSSREEYSSWLLPAVKESLKEAKIELNGLDLLAVATGPGSFTGVRVGLSTVKAWAEVLEKPVVGVSRLEALARGSGAGEGIVAASYDASRGQIFGAAYTVSRGVWEVLESEIVTAPHDFLSRVRDSAGAEKIAWVSLDPELLTVLPDWQEQLERGNRIIAGRPGLAGAIGEIAEERAKKGLLSSSLELDANYVRRADAEILWRPGGGHGR
jgi:tRNA threonylcarbamoyladenosine biosynthesis protein TsaB